ncbi:hypothetical protein GTY64_20390 [Streptomyces sp. SID8376]|nr:hypothetical protein [Streptomyces sp. SID8376]
MCGCWRWRGRFRRAWPALSDPGTAETPAGKLGRPADRSAPLHAQGGAPPPAAAAGSRAAGAARVGAAAPRRRGTVVTALSSAVPVGVRLRAGGGWSRSSPCPSGARHCCYGAQLRCAGWCSAAGRWGLVAQFPALLERAAGAGEASPRGTGPGRDARPTGGVTRPAS